MNIYKLKRKTMGLSRKEVAEKLNINIASLDSIESGYRNPGKELMYKFSKLYDCAMEELVEAEKNLQKKITKCNTKGAWKHEWIINEINSSKQRWNVSSR